MIPKNQLTFLFVLLTLVLLVACEPLAPEQTPRYIVVTGETPVGGASLLTPAGSPIAVVNTPEPTPTPQPTGTPTPTATPFRCGESQGRLIQDTIYSATVEDEIPYQMYLPPCFYETLQRYPFVVLMHGSGFSETMWVDAGAVEALDAGIADGTLPPMVLVMPYGGELAEWNDLPEGESWESVLLDELLPVLERDFCLWGNRAGRAIGGISRGGFWAFSIALRHPDMFSAVGGHSPFFAPENALPEYNPLDLAQVIDFDRYPLRIYMDNAEGDLVETNALLMAETLNERGIDHDYLIDAVGAHDLDYWRAHVASYLRFYGEQWPTDALALPSCLEPNPD